MRKILLSLLLIPFVCCAGVHAQWYVMTTGMNTNLRGVSAARSYKHDHGIALWASGSNGVVLYWDFHATEFKRLHVQGGDTLDFRSIRAINEDVAYVMSSGEGDKSRIYKTTDGGETWELQYTDKRPAFFLDDIVCFTETRCFALGDPIDGKFLILSTKDGKHWHELPRDNMPAILPGEGAFAASGSSLAIYGDSDIYFGTGGGAKARVFHSTDLGRTWTVADTPLAAGNSSSGVFSIVRVKNTVIAVGGDYKVANGTGRVAAYSTDGGSAWQLASPQPGGYRSAVASVSSTLYTVGPNGEDISNDGGVTWVHTNTLSLNAVAVLDNNYGWAVGEKGTIAGLANHNSEKIPMIDH